MQVFRVFACSDYYYLPGIGIDNRCERFPEPPEGFTALAFAFGNGASDQVSTLSMTGVDAPGDSRNETIPHATAGVPPTVATTMSSLPMVLYSDELSGLLAR